MNRNSRYIILLCALFLLSSLSQLALAGADDTLPGVPPLAPGTGYSEYIDPSGNGDAADPILPSISVTTDSGTSVTARFNQDAIFILTIQVAGNGSTRPSVGSYPYNLGTVINLLAIPSDGWEFDTWLGDVADPSSPSTTVIIDGDKTVTARFRQKAIFTLTMHVTGSGSTLPAAGTHNYIPGAVINLLAMPSDGWEFGGWIGDVADPSSPSTTVIMDSDKTVMATFTNPSAKVKPVINSFTAEPQTIYQGESALLSWRITGASSAIIDNGIGSVNVSNGSIEVSPTGMTSYTLTATNDAGTVTATVTVGVIVEEAMVVGGPADGATLSISKGVLEGVPTSIDAPAGAPGAFPFGLIEFTITDLTPGDVVTVYITLPRPIPPGATYYKYVKGAYWAYENVGGLNDGDATFYLIVGDGQQLGDADGFRNGRIVDPGGPSFPSKLYFPHVDSGGVWETEIAVINTSDTQGLSGTFTAYSDKGEEVSEDIDITLAPHARRELTVGQDFVNPGDIGYVVFEADSGSIVGYTKFYVEGNYRVAIPAAYEGNINYIYIPHIASDQSWWTGVSLLNTTSSPVDLTIDFDNGKHKSITLASGGHQAFTIRDLFGGEPQPDIHSAVITNASGVVGLELFGSAGAGTQLSGILLKDDTAFTIYYPHIESYYLNPASNWWTGIAAYNPLESSSTIIITPYTSDGTPLATQGLYLDPKGKYIGTVSELSLPLQTAWLMLNSTNPLTGFELFGTTDGNQLAGYTGVGISGTEGVFAKLEKEGWTGIAFVNTQNSAAVVALTAYDDNGNIVATETMNVGGHAKVVDLPENIFSQDISNATYLMYSSDMEIVGFQLNGSSDGMMLDGLPGMK
jgi:hypothetical protein